ncbi:MAG: oligosaccharide flippase family protein, partial [Proteobacteria bacterium]|nr:oligosaccharide flippase family protein [Pseudomonadota bacterium]
MKEKILRLGKNSMVYGVGTMLTRFINLLLLPLFTAYLTPADYGVLALLALLTMVAQPVFSLGMGSAMGPSYFEGNDPMRKSQVTWTSFLILLVSAVLLTLIAWLFPDLLSNIALQTPDYGHLVSLTLTGCAISILSTPFRQRIQFEERAKSFVILVLISSLISIAFSIIAVVFMAAGVVGMVVAQLTGHIVTFLLFFIVGTRETVFLFDKTIGKE